MSCIQEPMGNIRQWGSCGHEIWTVTPLVSIQNKGAIDPYWGQEGIRFTENLMLGIRAIASLDWNIMSPSSSVYMVLDITFMQNSVLSHESRENAVRDIQLIQNPPSKVLKMYPESSEKLLACGLGDRRNSAVRPPLELCRTYLHAS